MISLGVCAGARPSFRPFPTVLDMDKKTNAVEKGYAPFKRILYPSKGRMVFVYHRDRRVRGHDTDGWTGSKERERVCSILIG